jgi:5'-nucleotidase
VQETRNREIRLDDLPASPHTELLRHALEDGTPALARRVFVNRTLRMESIRYLGFDLDWTLAPYYRLPLQELIFTLALDRLVENDGYPKVVRRAEFRPNFPHRGLIVDRQEGTVLKMDRHRYVGRAYLGRSALGAEERGRLYRQERLDLKGERFYWVDTLFELPEVNLFAELVEMAQQGRAALPGYGQLFSDVRRAVDTVHAEGPLKSRIASDLPRYLPRDRDLALALERLALGGRRLMLITNSGWGYTDTLCSYLLDGALPGISSWRELFDLVVVSSAKPEFFRRRRPFVELDVAGNPSHEVAAPEWGKVYAGGSRAGLMELLQDPGESVLYVGDHIYGDIVSSKLTSTWRTALVVHELEEELERQHEVAPQIRHLAALKEELSGMGHELDDLRDVLTLYERLEAEGQSVDRDLLSATRERILSLRLEHKALRHRAADLQQGISMRYNPTWGSVFKQGGSQSFFGNQVYGFSCLYTSRVANFAYYGTNHYYRVLEDPMSHELEE